MPTVMVMMEAEPPRDTFILAHGDYRNKTEKVTPGVPSALSPLPANDPPNRLALARWLMDPSNPLTARVTVNRYWQMYFGTGLVKTAEDFGSQGEAPSHGIARLVGHRIHSNRVGCEEAATPDRHIIDLSPILGFDSCAARERSENRLLARARFGCPPNRFRTTHSPCRDC
jgi:hypothetical protein